MSAYRGMSSMELKGYLNGIEAQFMKWYVRTVYEECIFETVYLQFETCVRTRNYNFNAVCEHKISNRKQIFVIIDIQ